MSAPFTVTLSAFGDEIARDLRVQLTTLRRLQIPFLELRSAWSKNVAEFDQRDITRVRHLCRVHDIAISCLASPVGKTSLTVSMTETTAMLTRLFRLAEAMQTRLIRVFSFYPSSHDPEIFRAEMEEAVHRLGTLTDMASKEGLILVLENDKGLCGDTPERCAGILSTINNRHLRFAWDPANFTQAGIEQPTTEGWPLLHSFVEHIHIKDASIADPVIKVAGRGTSQIEELLVKLKQSTYQGFLALEPHLKRSGPRSGFSGATGMSEAARALRKMLATL